jgi:hypothetical protein
MMQIIEVMTCVLTDSQIAAVIIDDASKALTALLCVIAFVAIYYFCRKSGLKDE